MNPAQTDAYLHRLGLARPPVPTADALRELQVHHLRAVPFENLSVHLGEEIVLDENRLVDKVVGARRGGFCYELNGAFGALLTALGFEVTPLAARVHGDEGRLGIPYDHLALRVGTADGSVWLADVGFGKHSHHPLAFAERGAQPDPGGTFTLVEVGPDLDVVHDGTPQYRLELRPRELADFVAGAWWHSTSPASHFTQSLVCSRLLEDGGRITLSGRTLTVTDEEGARVVRELSTDEEVLEVYRKRFGIELGSVPEVRKRG
ncbi:arylamine N-acetyltransferase family protein [Streptomyces sp. YS-B37]|uniref:arylamine N-acetyltransferase family protein n=1 Tax=Streptomyces sp. YS-B37 TaxID=3407669 RepID=UPI003B5106E0